MTETLFAFDERNYRECQQAFRGDNNQEYYLGDYTIEGGSTIDVRAEKKAVGAYSLIRLQSSSKLFFRRSWSHIREDATDVTVLWFVKRGSLSLSHQSGGSIARAGDFIITKSMSPFTMECLTDEDSNHEVFHIVVPTHLLRRHIPQDLNSGFTVNAEARQFQIAEHILTDVFEDGDELSENTEQLLIDSALSVLSEALLGYEECTHSRQSLSEKRLQDVLRYMEIHLSDPKLNAAMLAEACGISQRYLSHLLRQNGTSFSNLLWDWRLKTAHQWLSTTQPGDISIAEVAFRVGFKSPAHFSRLFKRVYKLCPREYRARMQPPESQQGPARKDFFIGTPSALQ